MQPVGSANIHWIPPKDNDHYRLDEIVKKIEKVAGKENVRGPLKFEGSWKNYHSIYTLEDFKNTSGYIVTYPSTVDLNELILIHHVTKNDFKSFPVPLESLEYILSVVRYNMANPQEETSADTDSVPV